MRLYFINGVEAAAEVEHDANGGVVAGATPLLVELDAALCQSFACENVAFLFAL